jgi:lipid II:glycine glycyltransferase (peptidoglycan interpeptide bridge formation enzyme)
MTFEPILPEQKAAYNAIVSHPLQSYEWGEFREKSGVKVVRRGQFEKGKLTAAFHVTIHPIPRTSFTIGYLPKSTLPDRGLLEELQRIGKENNCIFIQLEPNVIKEVYAETPSVILKPEGLKDLNEILRSAQNDNIHLTPSAHPLFTKYTFMMDLTRSEDEILKGMHQKTRYNIRVAEKHGVKVREDNSDAAFERYWELTEETTRRQKFYAHTKKYHTLQWDVFNKHRAKSKEQSERNELTSHLFTAQYEGKILTAMLFFVFKDTLYYPYGASSNEHRNTMHSVLTMWEGIKFGKKLGLKKFDMWGSLSENPDQADPWFGFHQFKQRFGPELVEFIGSYDLVLNPLAYQGYKVADKLRWMYLKIKK